jgi:hypothetical protein
MEAVDLPAVGALRFALFFLSSVSLPDQEAGLQSVRPVAQFLD